MILLPIAYALAAPDRDSVREMALPEITISKNQLKLKRILPLLLKNLKILVGLHSRLAYSLDSTSCDISSLEVLLI